MRHEGEPYVSFRPQLNPQPLGAVKVPVPGTPVRLNSFLVSKGVIDAATDDVPFNKLSIIPIAANAANVYIGLQTMVKATLEGVLIVIGPAAQPNWALTTNVGMNTYHLQNLWVDADNANEGVYGSFDQV